VKKNFTKRSGFQSHDYLKSSRFKKSSLVIFSAIFAVIGGYLFFQSRAAVICDLNATSANLTTQINAATSGQTICLASGSYGSWSGTSKAITLTPASGAAVTMSINFNNGDKDFILDGTAMGGSLTITDGSINGNGTYSFQADGPHNIQVKNAAFTGGLNIDHVIDDGTWPYTILLDHNTHNNINTDGGRVRLPYDNHEVDSGVIVQNSTLRNGAGDGIQSGAGITILNNEFDNIQEGTFTSFHTDSIQLFGRGAAKTIVKGNYIHDGADGFTAYDGLGNATIENNVISSDSTNRCLEIYYDNAGTGDDPSTVQHNTLINGCTLNLNTKPGVYPAGVGTIVRDNIFTGGQGYSNGSTAGVNTHNMCPSTCGGNNAVANLTGTPSFIGPSTVHDGYLLSTGSAGKNAASDGTDIGIYALGGTTPTPPPPPPPPPSDTTPPTVSLTAPTAGSTVSGATVTLSANAADNVGVSGVQFKVDGNNIGSEDTASPFSIAWDSRTATNGSHTITAVARDAAGNSTTSSSIAVTTNNTTSCSTSSASWQNASIASQTSSFTFDYDATPNSTGIDSVIGLSSGAAANFTDLATTVRFNTTGTIDARNGAAYAAVNSLNYIAGTSYHFKVTVNVANHTYSVAVTPAGGSATTIATNYAFRTEQASVVSLANWATNSVTGNQTTCAVTVAAVATGPKAGDINGDNAVNITDLSLILSSYGQNTTQCVTNNAFKCDLSNPGDGIVNIFDLSILLSNYGK
jgi:hypothetical protein